MAATENRTPAGNRCAARIHADTLAGKSYAEDNPRARAASITAPASTLLARNRERQFWAAHVRAVDLDLSERTPEARILRSLAFAAWREAYLSDWRAA